MNTITIGIMSQEKIREMVLEVAQGKRKLKPIMSQRFGSHQ